MIYKSLLTAVFSIFAIFAGASSAAAQQSSWLDRPLYNWNRTGNRLPVLPRPPSANSTIDGRCLEQIRQPSSLAERAVTRLGWKLYGASQSYGATTIFTALSGVDGMCRPTGFQAFVYWGGRFVGTLALAPMDSRTDGALTDFSLVSPTSLAAKFARYSPSDALCCPSK